MACPLLAAICGKGGNLSFHFALMRGKEWRGCVHSIVHAFPGALAICQRTLAVLDNDPWGTVDLLQTNLDVHTNHRRRRSGEYIRGRA
jgi:hypothetical protein